MEAWWSDSTNLDGSLSISFGFPKFGEDGGLGGREEGSSARRSWSRLQPPDCWHSGVEPWPKTRIRAPILQSMAACLGRIVATTEVISMIITCT